MQTTKDEPKRKPEPLIRRISAQDIIDEERAKILQVIAEWKQLRRGRR